MQKKLFGFLLIVCMLLCLTVAASAAADLTDGTIDSAEDLLALMADDVTAATMAADYILTDDIDMTDVTGQSPIGSQSVPYTGTFDGAGKTISGLNISGIAGNNIALFAATKGATIKNLTIDGTITGQAANVAGFVARVVLPLAVENCVNKAAVSQNTSTTATGIGGIVGAVGDNAAGSLTIKNCVNEGVITQKGKYGAGILGHFAASSKKVNVLVQNCVNKATATVSVTGSAAGGVVGLVGSNNLSSGSTIEVRDCANYASVSGAGYTGGVVGTLLGNIDASAVAITLENLYNEGTVGGSTTYSGGVVGLLRAPNMTTGSVTATNLMENSASGYSVIGALGSGKAPALTMTGLYNAKNDGLVSTCAAENGSVTLESPASGAIITFVNCANASSDADALATLVASDTNNWVMETVDGVSKPNLAMVHTHTFDETTKKCTTCGLLNCDHEGTERRDEILTAATCNAEGVKDVYCVVCGVRVEENAVVAIDADNHAGAALNIVGAKYVYACCGAEFGDVSLRETVYVATTGVVVDATATDLAVGTEAKPFADFTQAFAAAAAYADANGAATVQIVDTASVPALYESPAYEGTVTITGGEMVINNRFFQNGDVVVENLVFNNTIGHVWLAQNHKLVMGSGITMKEGSNTTRYVVGGWQGAQSSTEIVDAAKALNTDITLRSGEWFVVVGGNRQTSAEYTATTKLTLGATGTDTLTITNLHPFTIYAGKTTANASATMIIDGNLTVTTFNTSTHGGDAAGDTNTYMVDVVLKQNADITATTVAPSLSSVTTNVNVYADQRNENAIADAELFVTKDASTVTQSTYAIYCVEKLGGHFGDGETCTECGNALTCTHPTEKLTANVTRVPTCAVVGLQDMICECGVTAQTDVEISVDPENHEAADYAWDYNGETGVYYVGCSACGAMLLENEVGVEPAVYLKSSGDDMNDGFTAETPVGSIYEAVARLEKTGGKVVFCDMYPIDSDTMLPEWNGTITFTSVLPANGVAAYGIRVAANTKCLGLGGNAIFDGLVISGLADTQYVLYIAANWHNLDMRYVRVGNKATSYIFAGTYHAAADDLTESTSVINIHGPALASGAGTHFYERVYLGSLLATPEEALEFTIANKHVTLNTELGYVTGAANAAKDRQCYIAELYMMSTNNWSAMRAVTTENCTSIANLNDNTVVNKPRTGVQNVLYSDSKGKIDNVEIHFNDNSQIGDSFQYRNAVNTKISVSTAADGRTEPLTKSMEFYKYGTFTENTEAKITFTSGSHSFANTIALADFVKEEARAGYPYLIEETITDECTWGDYEVTTEATPDSKGIETSTCSFCGRTKTREVNFVCTVHAYVAKADNTYYCANGCGTVAAPTAPVIIAAAPATVANGEVTVTVSIKATEPILGAYFQIEAPECLTLTSATSLVGEAAEGMEGFTVTGADTIATPYKAALLHMSNTAETIDADVMTLTFSVDETATEPIVVTVKALEAYDADEAEVAAAAVSAEISLAAEVVAGDVNSDGALSIVDALLILKAILNGDTLANADITGDGALSLVDVVRVLNNVTK